MDRIDISVRWKKFFGAEKRRGNRNDPRKWHFFLERVNVLSIIHTPSRADMYHTAKNFLTRCTMRFLFFFFSHPHNLDTRDIRLRNFLRAKNPRGKNIVLHEEKRFRGGKIDIQIYIIFVGTVSLISDLETTWLSTAFLKTDNDYWDVGAINTRANILSDPPKLPYKHHASTMIVKWVSNERWKIFNFEKRERKI